MIFKSIMTAAAAALTMCGVGLLGAVPAQADTFSFTSCHITGGCTTPATFGTVTVNQSGSNVAVDVVLTNGNRFVETGAGGNMLFAFNDSIAGSTITGITTTLNGATVTVIPGGVSGSTNLAPFQADGTGFFTAGVFCTVASDCNGGSTPIFNDLHFTVTNITLAQLETANAAGNLFIADILCGATQPGCTGGLTGPVDVSAVPGPIVGAGLPGLVLAVLGLVGLGRRRRQQA